MYVEDVTATLALAVSLGSDIVEEPRPEEG
jgi:hypothetical protein